MKSISEDTSLLEDIKQGGMKRQRAIAKIYNKKELRNQVVAFVHKNSGSRDEGVEIFHEGIIALDENIRKGKFRGESSISGYLYSICRFIWFNKLKRNKRMAYTDQEQELDQVQHETPESLSLASEQKAILDTLLGRLGAKCKQILELWKLSFSMEEIAERVGLGNAGIARRQRYNCYQKLLSIVEQEAGLKNVLK